MTSIQRFNRDTGEFETASYNNAQPAGVNFPKKTIFFTQTAEVGLDVIHSMAVARFGDPMRFLP